MSDDAVLQDFAAVRDVIQLDPEHNDWGPLLCIVDKIYAWGVQCYALIPEERHRPPDQMFLRVSHGHYQRIGKAEWAATDDPSVEPEPTEGV